MKRDYRNALCILIGAGAATSGIAAALASQAEKFRQLQQCEINAGLLHIGAGAWIASDLETRIDERKE